MQFGMALNGSLMTDQAILDGGQSRSCTLGSSGVADFTSQPHTDMLFVIKGDRLLGRFNGLFTPPALVHPEN